MSWLRLMELDKTRLLDGVEDISPCGTPLAKDSLLNDDNNDDDQGTCNVSLVHLYLNSIFPV